MSDFRMHGGFQRQKYMTDDERMELARKGGLALQQMRRDEPKLAARLGELLAYIDGYQGSHEGRSPTMKEMQEGIGIKSSGQLSNMMAKLIRGGFISRVPGRHRAIEILKR